MAKQEENINKKWKIKQFCKPKLKNTILIGGLPGIGNVGKIAIDFMIDHLKAKKLFELHSYNFPHCVFINEKNIIELPLIEIFYKNINGKSIVLLSGDIQPVSEIACYEFCDQVLDLFQKHKGKEIITLGGLAIDKIPKMPKVYCTGTDKDIINKYKTGSHNKNISEICGPIIGVSGLLTGLAGKRNLKAVTILAETFGHPAYLGVKGSKEILKLLNKKLDLKLNLKNLDKEINEIEGEFKTKKRPNYKPIKIKEEINYIG